MSFIDFNQRLVQKLPRWFYETIKAAEWLGYEVVDTKHTYNHEGWGCHLLTSSGPHGVVWALLPWQYGSCDRCDIYTEHLDKSSVVEDYVDLFLDLIEVYPSEQIAREVYEFIRLHEDAYCLRFRAIPFSHMTFPVLQHVFPTLIANEIVSVQPMIAPISSLFSMPYTYTTASDNIAMSYATLTGNTINDSPIVDSLPSPWFTHTANSTDNNVTDNSAWATALNSSNYVDIHALAHELSLTVENLIAYAQTIGLTIDYSLSFVKHGQAFLIRHARSLDREHKTT